MSKKVLIRESDFMDLLKGFFKVKSKGKEASFIQQIRKQNPELGDVWSRWNDDMDRALQTAKNNFIRMGKIEKAKEIDDLIKKYS
jgi:hypothetical protein